MTRMSRRTRGIETAGDVHTTAATKRDNRAVKSDLDTVSRKLTRVARGIPAPKGKNLAPGSYFPTSRAEENLGFKHTVFKKLSEEMSEGGSAGQVVYNPDQYDFEYWREKDAAMKNIGFENWLINSINVDDPNQRKWLQEIVPEVMQKRIDFIDDIADIQKRLARIQNLGPQSKEDLEFLYQLRSMDEQTRKIMDAYIGKPVHLLHKTDQTQAGGITRGFMNPNNIFGTYLKGNQSAGDAGPGGNLSTAQDWLGKTMLDSASAFGPTEFGTLFGATGESMGTQPQGSFFYSAEQ